MAYNSLHVRSGLFYLEFLMVLGLLPGLLEALETFLLALLLRFPLPVV
jgi:hypothetical protein